MTSQQVADKSEKSLAERLIVILLFSLLMATCIGYFFKHEGEFSRVGFKSSSQVFLSRITGIRAQWFMDGKPNRVAVKSMLLDTAEDITMVPVNHDGWVDVKNIPLKCEHVWQYVMDSPLVHMNQTISTTLITETNENITQYFCQYSIPSGEYFTYQIKNGKINFRY